MACPPSRCEDSLPRKETHPRPLCTILSNGRSEARAGGGVLAPSVFRGGPCWLRPRRRPAPGPERDAGAREDGPVDPRRDSGPGPSAPSPVASRSPWRRHLAAHLSEAALRTSGLTLVARTMSLVGYENLPAPSYNAALRRVDGEGALLPGGEDPTFFDCRAERAVGRPEGRHPRRRHLELCPDGGTCTTLSLKLQSTGNAHREDVGGPFVGRSSRAGRC